MNKLGSLGLVVVGVSALVWIALVKSGDVESRESGVLYYRSPMHPWVTSERPGVCTVCGMDLVPVYRNDRSTATNSTSVRNFSGATVTNAVVRDLRRIISVSGQLVPDRTKIRQIAAEVDGRIENVFWESIGQEVSKGEKLYSIYSSELREAERDFHLLFQQSQMNHSSRITAEHARLFQAMRARLTEYGLTPDQISKLPNKKDSVSTTDILSPVSGVLVDLDVHVGDRVKNGSRLMSIADVYQLWFEFDVYETDLEDVAVGQTVNVSADGNQTSTLISYINDVVHLDNRSSKARAVLRNPALREGGEKHRSFTIGSYAEGRIELNATAKLSLPREAFLSAGGGFVVFVREGEGFERRHVSVGFRGERNWEVTGVQPEEEVVMHGNLLLESESRL